MMILNTPLDEKTVRSLKVGDIVYVTGTVVTGRDEMHIRALREKKDVPKILNGSILYHCGPIMKESDDGWDVIAAGPTTSARMNSLEPEMIERFNIRAIIGKGGMDDKVLQTMKEKGCVYLSATGGAAVTLAEGLYKVKEVFWEDLGMPEAMWVFETSKLGPLVVTMDANGNSLYKDVRESLVR